MKFKKGDYIRKIDAQDRKLGGYIKDISDNPYDDTLHYSVVWFGMFGDNPSFGYSIEQIDSSHEIDPEGRHYENKVLEISDINGYIWHLPIYVVAHDRAIYYANTDPDTTYREEYDFTFDDSYEALDWYANNMNAFEIEPKFKLVSKPATPSFPSTDAEIRVKTL